MTEPGVRSPTSLPPTGEPGALLTGDERLALDLSGQLANVCRRIIGSGPQAENDWAEMAQRIHAVQHMVMAQAAARAYPAEFRLLGGVIQTGGCKTCGGTGLVANGLPTNGPDPCPECGPEAARNGGPT